MFFGIVERALRVEIIKKTNEHMHESPVRQCRTGLDDPVFKFFESLNLKMRVVTRATPGPDDHVVFDRSLYFCP